jgi:hypothetical protein
VCLTLFLALIHYNSVQTFLEKNMKRIFGILILGSLFLSACSSGLLGGSQVNIEEAVFSKSLDEQMKPGELTVNFYPDETVNLSIKVDGQPTKGVVKAVFKYRDTEVVVTTVDLGDAENGMATVVDGDTYIGFSLPHEEVLYISPNYHVDLFVDDKEAGQYPFSVIPPADAIPTIVKRTELAKGFTAIMDPIDPTTVFKPDESVVYIGNGDFGKYSWLKTNWLVNGNQVVDVCSQVLTLKDNLATDRFYFTCPPPGEGWPVGTHKIVLTVDDEVADEIEFTVE